MEQKANSFLETEPLGALMAKYAVPCVISGLVLTALYLALQEPILTLFGGRVNEETFHHTKEYFFFTANWRRNTCLWAFAAFCPRFPL